MLSFRNDYSFGAHPDVMRALAEANATPSPAGYGFDSHCESAANRIKELCSCPEADVHFLIGGTSTNFTAICAFLRSWESVLCADTGHINTHEAGAVEATGHKIIAVPSDSDGKICVEDLNQVVLTCADEHLTKPKLVYLSNATEMGGVYNKAELTEISVFCRNNGLLLFLDGARLGCALTSPKCDLTLADIACLCDAFYIGGTKNGAMMGEALVICNKEYQDAFFRVQKQRGGVLAKGWLLGIQFDTLLKDNLYFKIAKHANEMAADLQSGIEELGYRLQVNSPTNQVFFQFPKAKFDLLFEECPCEIISSVDEDTYCVRFVTCFATTEEDVNALLQLLAKLK